MKDSQRRDEAVEGANGKRLMNREPRRSQKKIIRARHVLTDTYRARMLSPMANNSQLTIASVASQGGRARAKSLTKKERSESARRAVEARWEKAGKISKVPVATHGSADHPLRIGEIEIPCYVLDDGRRIFSQRGLQNGLGMNHSGGAQRLLNLVQRVSANPDQIKELTARITCPIKFQPLGGGIPAHGYEATILVDLCDAILEGRKDGRLDAQQERIATRCEILVRSFAKVGIIALVDEATGYQYDRARRDLEQHLSRFLAEGLRRWVKTFPADYFKHLCRLKGVPFRGDMRLPQYFGNLTNDLVYRRLAPGLLRHLKERRAERGKPSNKLTQWLSDDVGHPELLLHLGTVVGLMKLQPDGHYDEFKKHLDVIAPMYPETPGLFDDPTEWESNDTQRSGAT